MSRRAPGRHRAPRTSVLATILPTPTSASAMLPTQHAMRTTAVLLLTGGLAATGVVPAGADPAPVDGSSTSSEAPRDWSQRGADEESAQSADDVAQLSKGQVVRRGDLAADDEARPHQPLSAIGNPEPLELHDGRLHCLALCGR